MDFDIVLYIILVIGSIAASVVKTMKKDEQERQAKKNRQRPIEVETSQETPTGNKKKKRQTASPLFSQETSENAGEYFSYETMSDRDFAKEFEEVIEENNETIKGQPSDHHYPAFDEGDVFKGVVWSEILKRKY